jgi:hypothetical protein
MLNDIVLGFGRTCGELAGQLHETLSIMLVEYCYDILILYEESRADSGKGIMIMKFFLLVASSFVGLAMAHLRCLDVQDTTSSHRLSIELPQRAGIRLTRRCPHNYGPKGTCAGRRKHNAGTADCEATYFIVRIRFCRLDRTFGLI